MVRNSRYICLIVLEEALGMRPPPKGPNTVTWPAGAGTLVSHLRASDVLSGRSGEGSMRVIASNDIYIVL
jgi:hypothetical protein